MVIAYFKGESPYNEIKDKIISQLTVSYYDERSDGWNCEDKESLYTAKECESTYIIYIVSPCVNCNVMEVTDIPNTEKTVILYLQSNGWCSFEEDMVTDALTELSNYTNVFYNIDDIVTFLNGIQ